VFSIRLQLVCTVEARGMKTHNWLDKNGIQLQTIGNSIFIFIRNSHITILLTVCDEHDELNHQIKKLGNISSLNNVVR
jgi:hypothetical protein